MNISLPQLSCSSRPAGPQQHPRRVDIVRLTWGLEREWEKFVHDHPDGTIFHTLKWRDAVGKSYEHASEYLVALTEGRIVGVLPMFVVRRPLIGRMLISVPYAVGGGILACQVANPPLLDPVHALLAAAQVRAKTLRCTLIDFRSEHAQIPDLQTADAHVGFERELPQTPAEVTDWLPRKARAVVRNARTKYGLTCEFGPENLRTVWQLYSRNMRRLGSINYPFRFFQNLAAEFGDQSWCCVIRQDGRAVAGLFTLLFRDRVLPYFFGCTSYARECGAANLIYASVMERAVAEGYRIFDFGRTRRDNKGSFDFKRFHGFEPRPLEYQRYFVEATKPIELTPTNPAIDFARRLWPKLPLAVTRPAGAFLSQYIPG